MADKSRSSAARIDSPRRRIGTASVKAPGPSPAKKPKTRTLSWPVWTAVVLTLLYVALHFQMVSDTLELWGGLLSALVFGQ